MLSEMKLSHKLSERRVCDVLNLCRNTFRKTLHQATFCGPKVPVSHSRKQAIQPNALSEVEKQTVMEILNASPSGCNRAKSRLKVSCEDTPPVKRKVRLNHFSRVWGKQCNGFPIIGTTEHRTGGHKDDFP